MRKLTEIFFLPVFLFKKFCFFIVSSSRQSGLLVLQLRRMLVEYWQRRTVGRGSLEPLGPEGSKQLGFLNP